MTTTITTSQINEMKKWYENKIGIILHNQNIGINKGVSDYDEYSSNPDTFKVDNNQWWFYLESKFGDLIFRINIDDKLINLSVCKGNNNNEIIVSKGLTINDFENQIHLNHLLNNINTIVNN